jgi:hypothetical protein
MGWAAVFKNDRETPAATWVVAALWPGWLLCFVAASCVGLGGLFRREGGPYDGNRR